MPTAPYWARLVTQSRLIDQGETTSGHQGDLVGVDEVSRVVDIRITGEQIRPTDGRAAVGGAKSEADVGQARRDSCGSPSVQCGAPA